LTENKLILAKTAGIIFATLDGDTVGVPYEVESDLPYFADDSHANDWIFARRK
jgi:hypothetical protein